MFMSISSIANWNVIEPFLANKSQWMTSAEAAITENDDVVFFTNNRRTEIMTPKGNATVHVDEYIFRHEHIGYT